MNLQWQPIDNAQTASMATQVWNFRYKFHIGDFIGLPVRILWLFISLLPLLFVITGAYMVFQEKD
jgi:uncharacterized iron-regulated membrane protein